MSAQQFNPDQRLRDLETLSLHSFLSCRSTLFPTADELVLPNLQSLTSEVSDHIDGKDLSLPAAFAAREFAFGIKSLQVALAEVLSNKDTIRDRIEVAVGLAHTYFGDNKRAAELFAEVVLHKLSGDTSNQHGVMLVNLKLSEIVNLVGPERLKQVLENQETECTAARRLFEGKLCTVEGYLAEQFSCNTKVVLCSVGLDSKIGALGDTLIDVLPQLRSIGVTHFGIPDFSGRVGRGYFPSATLLEESKQLIQLLENHSIKNVSTHVPEIDFSNIHQSIANALEQRFRALPTDSRIVAFVESDQVYRDKKRSYYAGEVTPLARRLEDLWGAGSVKTVRWVPSDETLRGNAAVGRNASTGLMARDILRLAAGEYCIAKNDGTDPAFASLVRPHNGLETDAILLEG